MIRGSIREWRSENTPEFTLVLIHGSMDRHSGFRRLAKSLSTTNRVLTYDRRGYAGSSQMSGPFGVDQQVADLLEVIDARPVVLVGHSFGGVVALSCASRHPELVQGVVVYESPMSWEPWWPQDSGGARAVAMADDPEAAAEAFLIRFIGERLWNRLPEGTKRSRRAEGEALVGELGDLRARAAWKPDDLRVPVVSGYGSRAREYVRRASQIIGALPDGRAVMLAGAHHNAHSAEPEAFERLLIEPLFERLRTGHWPDSGKGSLPTDGPAPGHES